MDSKQLKLVAEINPSVDEMWKCYECGLAPNERLHCENCGRHKDDQNSDDPRRFLIN